MTVCVRERVMVALETEMNALMVGKYGDGHPCSRNPDEPADLSPAQTPYLWMVEQPASTLGADDAANGWPWRSVVVTFQGALILSAGTINSGLVRSQLNEWEALLDGVLAFYTLDGIHVAILPEGDVESHAGEDRGVIEYSVRVTFPRELEAAAPSEE